VSIYDYLDYRSFLKEWCAEQKKLKKGISYRWLSMRIGIRSSGYLSWVIAGKRNISLSLALELVKALKLKSTEGEYFITLVQFNQASDPDEKNHFFEQLNRIKPLAVKTIRDDQQQYYSQWYYAAIRELVSLYPITDNYRHAASLLAPPIRPSEAKEALELLLRLKLITKNNNGIYQQTDKVISSSGSPIDPAIIHRYQNETIELARHATNRFPREERDISTVTMSINGDALKKIQKRAELFRLEVMGIARTCTHPDRIFQSNCQLFPLSKDKKGESL